MEADDATFASVAGRRLQVPVNLWAPWSGPCRIVNPPAEEATRRFTGQLKMVKVNIDHAPVVAHRFGIQAVPTLLVLRDGKVVARQVGAPPGPALGR